MPLDSEVEISGIDGHIHLPEDKNQPVVFVAGGIGIAPVMSVLRYCHEQSWPYNISLIYTNENHESAAFLDELGMFSKESKNFNFIPFMTNDPDLGNTKTHITAQVIKRYIAAPEMNKYFITGIPKFSTAMLVTLKEAGVTIPQITMEIFTGY